MFSDGDGEDLKDLIDDNPEADEESEGEGDKRKHEDSELEEDLSDDDYDLIEENLGIKVKRKVGRASLYLVQRNRRSYLMPNVLSSGPKMKECTAKY